MAREYWSVIRIVRDTGQSLDNAAQNFVLWTFCETHKSNLFIVSSVEYLCFPALVFSFIFIIKMCPTEKVWCCC